VPPITSSLNRALRAQARPRRGWRRFIVAAITAATVAGGLAVAQIKPDTSTLEIADVAIASKPIVSFDRAEPALQVFGKLTFRGGLVLSSESASFGGWSGLTVSPNGQSFIAVSDAGSWLDGQFVYKEGALVGVANTRIGPLKARDGSALKRNRDRDAEAVVLVSGTIKKGSLLIAFEQNDRIGRFPIDANGIAPPSSYVDMPAASKKMRVDGFEAVTLIRGGTYEGGMIAFAERSKSAPGQSAGWLWTGSKAKPQTLSLHNTSGFEVTDVAGLPDGRVLVLERRFRWTEGVKMRLCMIAARDIKPGAALACDELLVADMGQDIDNMEGLAVSQGDDGETVITLISDDNFNHFIQRTIVLQFALRE
jgi:hypothetical protein